MQRSENVARFGKPKPCPECPKYKTCRKLCPEVEQWVSQDHVGSPADEIIQIADRPLGYNDFVDNCNQTNDPVIPDPEVAAAAWSKIVTLKLPKTSFEFAELYYHQGKTLAQVAKELKISSQAANERHKKLKRDVKDRLQRIEIWEKMKDEIGTFKDLYTHDAVNTLYFGFLWDRVEIAIFTKRSYASVQHIIQDALKKYLDK